MPLVILPRRQPPPSSPAIVVARDRVIGAAITGLLGICAAGVTYIARTIPIKFTQIDAKQQNQEQQLERLSRNQERQVTILEQHDKRLDSVDLRLTRMER